MAHKITVDCYQAQAIWQGKSRCFQEAWTLVLNSAGQSLGRIEHVKLIGQAENNAYLSSVAENFLGHIRRKTLASETLVRDTVQTSLTSSHGHQPPVLLAFRRAQGNWKWAPNYLETRKGETFLSSRKSQENHRCRGTLPTTVTFLNVLGKGRPCKCTGPFKGTKYFLSYLVPVKRVNCFFLMLKFHLWASLSLSLSVPKSLLSCTWRLIPRERTQDTPRMLFSRL